MINIYTSPTGSGDGLSVSTPASLAAAIALVQTSARNGASRTDDITLWFLDGTYTLASTIVLGEDDSGRDGYTVYWKAYSGASPILSGGQVLTSWSNDTQSFIKRATASAYTRDLWVNNQRKRRVQYQGATDMFLGGPGYEDFEGQLPAFSRPQDLEFVFIGTTAWHSAYNTGNPVPMTWVENRVKVINSTKNGGTSGFTMNANWGQTMTFEEFWLEYPDTPDVIEHAYEFLATTTKGEFYVNSTTGVVYYVPTDTENMATASAIVGKLENIIKCLAADPVHDINISGLQLSYTTYLQPDTDGVFLQHQANMFASPSDPAKYDTPKHAIHLKAASNVVIDGCTFKHLGGGGIFVDRGCSSITINSNLLQGIGAAGITVGDGNLWAIPVADEIHNITINNNYLRYVGIQYLGAVAIALFHAYNITSEYNSIYDVPYDGYHLGFFNYVADIPPYPPWPVDGRAPWNVDQYYGNYKIKWNRVIRAMTHDGYIHDGAAIYTCGHLPNTEVSYNYVDDVAEGQGYHAARAHIYFDVWSGGLTYRKNVFTLNSQGNPDRYSNEMGPNPEFGVSYCSDNYIQEGLLDPLPGSPVTPTGTIRLSDENVNNWPLEARIIYSNSGSSINREITPYSYIVNEKDGVRIYGWHGATIYADFDNPIPSTVRIDGEKIDILGNILYYYISDSGYSTPINKIEFPLMFKANSSYATLYRVSEDIAPIHNVDEELKYSGIYVTYDADTYFLAEYITAETLIKAISNKFPQYIVLIGGTDPPSQQTIDDLMAYNIIEENIIFAETGATIS